MKTSPSPLARGPSAIRALAEREERPLTWVAKKLDMSLSHLTRIADGERPLLERHARGLADVFDVPIETFLPEDSNEQTT